MADSIDCFIQELPLSGRHGRNDSDLKSRLNHYASLTGISSWHVDILQVDSQHRVVQDVGPDARVLSLQEGVKIRKSYRSWKAIRIFACEGACGRKV